MPNHEARLDDVFRALGDPTRRAVVERLARGPCGMTELAGPFRMSLPSFSQHMDVLEACGLVRSRKDGRVRTYRLDPGPLRTVETWMDRQRSRWERRLDQLDEHLRAMEAQERKKR